MAAGVHFLPAEICLSKRVQEMALNGDEPSQLYICRDGEEATEEEEDGAKYFSSLIPVIDLSLLLSQSDRREGGKELEKLKTALSSWGCFQARGHGISCSLLNEMRKIGREFFEQPMEEKKKQSKEINEFEGYGADQVPEVGQFLDWSDRLVLNLYPEDKRNPKLWPQTPSFRDALERYTEEMKKFTQMLSKAMAKSLKIEEKSFIKQFGERATLQVRFNYYSCCKKPELVLGLKPHADGSGYTIILQDDNVEGLQVQKDGKWIIVPSISDALFVLMGDQMEIMSNGIFKSPMHRVVTNSKKERVSIAMFYMPEPNKEIGPEQSLINDENPMLFHKVKDYADVHWQYYQQGKRALHVAQVI